MLHIVNLCPCALSAAPGGTTVPRVHYTASTRDYKKSRHPGQVAATLRFVAGSNNRVHPATQNVYLLHSLFKNINILKYSSKKL